MSTGAGTRPVTPWGVTACIARPVGVARAVERHQAEVPHEDREDRVLNVAYVNPVTGVCVGAARRRALHARVGLVALHADAHRRAAVDALALDVARLPVELGVERLLAAVEGLRDGCLGSGEGEQKVDDHVGRLHLHEAQEVDPLERLLEDLEGDLLARLACHPRQDLDGGHEITPIQHSVSRIGQLLQRQPHADAPQVT